MKRTHSLFTAALLSCAAVTAHAQELYNYVQQCQTELEFTASQVKQMNCNDGYFFASNSRSGINDYVVHQKVNQNVDMIAACRWGDSIFGLNQNTKFMQLEMIIHNRVKGGTCFFAAKDVGTGDNRFRPVSPVIVPVTSFPAADGYWLKPSEMANKLLYSNGNPFGGPDYQEKMTCVRCHSQGPYIASRRIAPFLANLGLLNDGHHTKADFSASGHYYVVGSREHTQADPGSHPLGNWNYLIARNNRPATDSPCSGACHALARDSVDATLTPLFVPIGDLTSPLDRGAPVLPSIKTDINELIGSGGMEPWQEDSPYHWINNDQPGTDAVEIETFTSHKLKYPVTYYCGAPGWIEANAVGTGSPFNSLAIAFIPNKLRNFNLRDGLVCLNADQPSGQTCRDYQVSYKCPITTEVPKWVGPYNKDINFSDDGDHEERSKSWNEARTACGNKDPVAMRADVLWSGGVVQTVSAPNDRLAQFTPSGLVCKNSDQGSGQSCSSYAVRYVGCRARDDAKLARLRNAWTSSTFTNRYLTTTNTADGSEVRGQGNNYQYQSQDWTIEYQPDGNVRIFDVWSRKYLTASSTTSGADVVVRNSDLSLQRQYWAIETISGSSEVRFRNLGTSNRYLTVGTNTSDPYFVPITSQTLSSSSASQRWLIQ